MILFLVTTTLGLLNYNAGELIKPFFSWAYRTSSIERQLLTEKGSLKLQQSSLSMVDDFAKFSKLQRKINKIDMAVMDLQTQRLRNNFIVRTLCTYVVRIMLGGVSLYLGYYYRDAAVFQVSKRFSFFPIHDLISYPNNEENNVSVPFWIMCCTTVGTLIKIGG